MGLGNLKHDEVTRRFARVIGPFVAVVSATAVGRASDMRTLLADFSANLAWSWICGAFVLLSGLVVIALHQHWRGAPAVIVSVFGWMAVLKGFFLMAFPQAYLSFASAAVDAGTWWRTGLIAVAAVGVYLTFAGWMAAPNRTPAKR